MRQMTFRLLFFVLIIIQLSIFNLAQTKPDSTSQQSVTKLEQVKPTECELKGIDIRVGLDYYEKLLRLCRATGNKAAISKILYSIANIHLQEERREEERRAQSLKAYQESLTLSESVGDKAGVISAMLNIGETHRIQRNTVQASEYFHKALMLSEELGDKRLIAQSLQFLGMFHSYQNNLRKHADQALTYFEREVKLREELEDEDAFAAVLSRIGFLYQVLYLLHGEDPSKALEYYFKSLKLREELGNKLEIIGVLRNIGSIYQAQGYYSQSIEFFGRCLKLDEELNNRFGIDMDLMRIARTYQLQGNVPKALEYYQRQLKLQQELHQELQAIQKANLPIFSLSNTIVLPPDISKIFTLAGFIPSTLNSIGVVYFESNKYDLAAEYFQKALQFEQAQGETNGSRSTLYNLGLLNQRQGKYILAIEYYQKTLSVCKQNGGNSSTTTHYCVVALSSIAYMHGLQGDFANGLEFAERASILSKQLVHHTASIEAYWLLGNAYRVLGQFDRARRAFEEAISIFEWSRAKIIEEHHRLTFIGSTTFFGQRQIQMPFEFYIDVLMQLHKQRPTEGYDALALQASERFRARLLLELLNEAQANIRQGVEPKLLAQERVLLQQLNERAEQQTRLLNGKNNVEQGAALQKEIDALTVEFQQTKAQIRINSPRYVALTQSVSLTLQEIQRDLLDADTVLLEYALGDERSYLWVVTSNTLTNYELPKRTEIEKDVRRVVALLNDGKRWASDARINAEYVEAAAPLTRTLLPPALLSQLKGKRLVIVSDGALQYLPFGALPQLQGQQKTNSNRQKAGIEPLVVSHEIISLPSASTLTVLRRETANRPPAAKSVESSPTPFSQTPTSGWRRSKLINRKAMNNLKLINQKVVNRLLINSTVRGRFLKELITGTANRTSRYQFRAFPLRGAKPKRFWHLLRRVRG